MKLIYATPSPFARKVRVVVGEKGMGEDVEFVHASPFDNADDVRTHNPLGKVPALVLPDGQVLFDSPVICEYLDSYAKGPRLIPADGPERWKILRWQALADGILDAAFNIACEHRRPVEERSRAWIDRWASTIERGLTFIDKGLDTLTPHVSLAHVSVAVIPDYIDLRAAQYVSWRKGRPTLAKWFDEFASRSSMSSTHPTLLQA